jgi:TorA maturation chaperone TorD
VSGNDALTEDTAQLAAHAQLFSLCARLFAEEVDAPLYRALIAEPLKGALAPLGLRWVSAELEALGEGRALEELAAEYCRLFVGPSPACPPYHSAFSGAALLGARHAKRVEELAARHELEVVLPPRIVSADHIAIELALLAAALGRAVDDEAPSHDSAARELTERLLLPWLPEFLTTLAGAAVHAPYTTMSALLPGLLSLDGHVTTR